MSKTVLVDEFQAHPLELIEQAAENQEELVVVKDGKTLGTFVPLAERRRKTLEQMRADGVKILGDIMEPVAEWELNE